MTNPIEDAIRESPAWSPVTALATFYPAANDRKPCGATVVADTDRCERHREED